MILFLLNSSVPLIPNLNNCSSKKWLKLYFFWTHVVQNLIDDYHTLKIIFLSHIAWWQQGSGRKGEGDINNDHSWSLITNVPPPYVVTQALLLLLYLLCCSGSATRQSVPRASRLTFRETCRSTRSSARSSPGDSRSVQRLARAKRFHPSTVLTYEASTLSSMSSVVAKSKSTRIHSTSK